MYIQLTDSGAQAPAVDINTVIQHTRIDSTADNNLVAIYIQAATDVVERYLNRNLISRAMTFTFTATTPPANWNFITSPIVVFPFGTQYQSTDERYVDLPRPPISNVTNVAVTWWSGDVDYLTLGTDYNVSYVTDPARVKFYTYNTLNQHSAFTIQYTSGYGANLSSVPITLQYALMLQVANMYEHRGDDETNISIRDIGGGITLPVQNALRPYRNWHLGY